MFGRYIGKQAISLSGPGINAFHYLWNYEGTSENFEISSIDLVPDMDLVPRVEISNGTILFYFVVEYLKYSTTMFWNIFKFYYKIK